MFEGGAGRSFGGDGVISSLTRILTEPSAETARRTNEDVRRKDLGSFGDSSWGRGWEPLPVICSWLLFLAMGAFELGTVVALDGCGGPRFPSMDCPRLDGGVKRTALVFGVFCKEVVGLEDVGASDSLSISFMLGPRGDS